MSFARLFSITGLPRQKEYQTANTPLPVFVLSFQSGRYSRFTPSGPTYAASKNGFLVTVRAQRHSERSA